MIQSRLTAKAQTTVPMAVRRALGLKPGDAINYEINGDKVVCTRAASVDADGFLNNVMLFSEWASDEDSAYDTLGQG
ncbi:MAG: type II toxin-antitoxin system PrlF family antitoxin [Alphaproteobacteria bacterium]|nr:type II toxin-antitoxin system PrlF family antitoxin [Alphaproteobacteria bacterium]